MDQATNQQSATAKSWYLLGVLTTLVLLGMVDRLSLTLLVAPIKRELAIDDTWMSLLLGPSFGLFYATIGLPVGHLVDRYNRRNLLLVGGAIWTMMTFVSAFAPSFGWLFVCRAGVGVGEAVLSPAVYSIIRDSFPERQRPVAYGITNMGSPLGSGFALVAIGHIATWASVGYFAEVPLIGGLTDWRTVLAIVGLGGLPLVLMLLTTSEPRRPSQEVATKTDEASVAAVLAHFREWWGPYVCIFLSTGFYGTSLNGMLSWAPEAISRAWDSPINGVGPKLGTFQLILAPTGLLLAGYLLTRWRARHSMATLAYPGSIALAIAAIMLALWSSTSGLDRSWIFIGAALFLMPWAGVTHATLLALLTPSRMMGKITAVNFLMLGLVGMIAGPVLNPLLAHSLFEGPRAMLHGIGLGSGATMAVASLLLVLCGMLIARKHGNADRQELLGQPA